MMELTRKGEYAIRGILFLASLRRNEVCILSEIATMANVPQTSLAKIFQQFSKAGLVKSFRGTGGGFALGRPPQKITLLQVVEAVDCAVVANHCVLDADSCHRNHSCGMFPVWVDVQQQVRGMLDKVTLKDLAAQK